MKTLTSAAVASLQARFPGCPAPLSAAYAFVFVAIISKCFSVKNKVKTAYGSLESTSGGITTFAERGLRACGSGKNFGGVGMAAINSAAVRGGRFLGFEVFCAGFFRVVIAGVSSVAALEGISAVIRVALFVGMFTRVRNVVDAFKMTYESSRTLQALGVKRLD